MPKMSLIEEAREVSRAVALIELGARMQVLESELTLSRDRLIRIYREVKDESPPKGMLPSSADWYMTWQANIHSSLFYHTYTFLRNERSYAFSRAASSICIRAAGAKASSSPISTICPAPARASCVSRRRAQARNRSR